ncbi:MAG: ABC transporter permease [Dehalococcoidia bacterium]|nr:ABC transporter permease [Dehalococcoidia bacterium]
MKELWGVPMTYIAASCLVVTVLILLFIAFIAVRNPVMFKMGLRNIPRRKGQTALIVVGLMLSTVIMSAAFGTGDTLSTSVTEEVYGILGEADEIINWDTDKQPAPVDQQLIPLAEVERWQQQFADDPDIEAFVPFISEGVPLLNTRTRLNQASAQVVAFREEDAAALGGLKDLSGNAVQVTGREMVVNEDLAEEIDAQPGDTIVAFYGGEEIEFTVKAIAPSQVLSGALGTGDPEGAAVDFAVLAEITGKGENADAVFVSNTGGVKEGMKRSDAVEAKLLPVLEDTPYQVQLFKKEGIRFAELIGSGFTTVFIVFGLFSIAAGVLLIFLIFVMLAAERKPEMGMARAVGAKRRQLVESFLAEGMGYDLGAAVVGLFAGMLVTVAMVQIVTGAAGDDLGFDMTVTFAPRSMITAFCLGLIATFIVIFIASWRASRLNITAAIRDLPETKPINPERATWRGYVRAVLNGVIALGLPLGLALFLLGPIGMVIGAPLAIIGLVSPWFYALRGSSVALPADDRSHEPPPKWPWILGLCLLPVFGLGLLIIIPYFIALGLVRLVRDRKPSNMPTWLPLAGIVVPPLGFVVALLQDAKAQIAWSAGIATAFAIMGAAFTYGGLDTNTAFMFLFGVSLLFLWVALTLRYFHIAERLSFTVTSLVLLALWYTPSSVTEPVLGELDGDIELFFLSGMVMVTCGVFIVIYNADIALPALANLGSRFGRIVPALKTGVAYPLTARFRTGMTMLMIGLIMFSLVMMATMNTNFANVFLNDDTRGGMDVLIGVNSNNPVDDLQAALEEGGVDTSKIQAAAEMRIAYPFETEVENIDQKEVDDETPEFLRYMLIGADDTFMTATNIAMKYYAAGYETDQEVWQALRDNPTYAVIPASLQQAQEGFVFGMDDSLLSLDTREDGFEPFTLRVRDPGTGKETTLTVIGVMKEAADTFITLGGGFTGGIITSQETVADTLPSSQGQRFYLQLTPGTDAREFAKSVEAALVQASADSLEKLLDDQQRIQTGFMLVFQGFMGLGLVVGIAALAVIASRAVVERRQQIGMLRAIGYQRSMVALSFLFESGFIAVSGIVLGLGLGLSLAWVLFATGDIGEEAANAPFIVPWMNLLVICAIAFVASMVMTFLPARQASRVPVAEALRYE